MSVNLEQDTLTIENLAYLNKEKLKNGNEEENKVHG